MFLHFIFDSILIYTTFTLMKNVRIDLELFSGPDGNLLELLATAVQLFPDLLNLPPVRRDDPDLFRGDLVPL